MKKTITTESPTQKGKPSQHHFEYSDEENSFQSLEEVQIKAEDQPVDKQINNGVSFGEKQQSQLQTTCETVEVRITEPAITLKANTEIVEHLNFSILRNENPESIWHFFLKYDYFHSIIYLIKAWESQEKLIQQQIQENQNEKVVQNSVKEVVERKINLQREKHFWERNYNINKIEEIKNYIDTASLIPDPLFLSSIDKEMEYSQGKFGQNENEIQWNIMTGLYD